MLYFNKKTRLFLWPHLLGLVLVIACSDKDHSGGSGAGATTSHFAISVATDAELPECNPGLENQLAFSVESEKFFLCDGASWVAVVGPGAKGSTGMVVVNDLATGCKELITGIDSDGDGTLTKKDEQYNREVLCDAKLAAESLYDQYRTSVYRMSVTCTYPDASTSQHSWTGFRCAEDKICTAGHVLACYKDPLEGSISNLIVRAVSGPKDSETLGANLYQTTSPSLEKATACSDLNHVVTPDPDNGNLYCLDLGRVVVPEATFTADMKIMPLTSGKPSATEPFPEALTPVLSLSFPLGFQELYTDLGQVNTNDIDGCSASFPCSGLDFSTNNVTDSGSSGSPLIAVETGEVIGVLVSGTTPNQNANFSWAVGAWMYDEAF